MYLVTVPDDRWTDNMLIFRMLEVSTMCDTGMFIQVIIDDKEDGIDHLMDMYDMMGLKSVAESKVVVENIGGKIKRRVLLFKKRNKLSAKDLLDILDEMWNEVNTEECNLVYTAEASDGGPRKGFPTIESQLTKIRSRMVQLLKWFSQ